MDYRKMNINDIHFELLLHANKTGECLISFLNNIECESTCDILDHVDKLNLMLCYQRTNKKENFESFFFEQIIDIESHLYEKIYILNEKVKMLSDLLHAMEEITS